MERKEGFTSGAIRACRRLLGVRPSAIDTPGGSRRRSIRVVLNGQPAIVTRRRNANRAALELGVLTALGAKGAPVPRVIAHGDGWLIQEDLGPQRLSAVVSGPDAALWLDRAASSLAQIHEAGRQVGLAAHVAPIGRAPEWLRENVLAAPAKVGRLAGIASPAFDAVKLAKLLSAFAPSFIKWDARPGNAIARADGCVGWFDWEHCGVRCTLDDFVWLFADEYVDVPSTTEVAILERHLEKFGDTMEDSNRYLRVFGTFHICVRLGLILAHRGDGAWWDPALCLERDKVLVTQEAALRLCRRGADWAARAPETMLLAPWFGQIGAALSTS